jgi:FAD:protein FMN transferase
MLKQTRAIMGMPITIEVVDREATTDDMKAVFDYFRYIDDNFSPFKAESEVTLINQGRIKPKDYSRDMHTILEIALKTKKESDGYFDIGEIGKMNPSGVVKGWAIKQASELLKKRGIKNFYIDAGGDIETSGINEEGKLWKIGIRNPYNKKENIKILQISNRGVATSGTYERGKHIINPKNGSSIDEIVSLTVIGPDICEADRYATAAFAMGNQGIKYIESLPGFEGYMVDNKAMATVTSHFDDYIIQ